MNKRIDQVPIRDVMQALVSWPWPGNVRELENFLERSVILSQGALAPCSARGTAAPKRWKAPGAQLAEMEREYVVHVPAESDGVISAAANRLGVPRTTLNTMLRKLGVARKDY